MNDCGESIKIKFECNYYITLSVSLIDINEYI